MRVFLQNARLARGSILSQGIDVAQKLTRKAHKPGSTWSLQRTRAKFSRGDLRAGRQRTGSA